MMHRVVLAAAFAACAAVVALHAPQRAGAADAAAVLAKHKAYVGWAYGDGTLKSARITVESLPASPPPTPDPAATPDPFGKPNYKTVVLRRELLYKAVDSGYGIDLSSEGFTGSVFWRANENGNVVTRRLRDAREALTEDIIDAEAYAEVPTATRPNAEFDGKPSAVVRVEPKTGALADVYFDPETGAMRGYVLEPDVPVERVTVHVTSYAEFAPGKRYVAGIRVNDFKRGERVTSFEPNVAITDAELRPPATRSHWTFGPPNPSPVEVVEHSTLYSNSGARAVHVALTVNGHVGHFLFDSGSGGMLMSEAFAKAAGAKELGRTAYSGVNGRGVSATIGHVDTIGIGGSTLHDVYLTISKGGGAAERGLDGIMGYEVLAAAVVHVNLVDKTLTVVDPNGFEAEVAKGAYAFPVDQSLFHAGVPVKVNDNVLPSVWLDTGDDFFVILPHELEKKTVSLPSTLNIGKYEFAMKIYFGGVDGTGAEPANCVRLNEIQIGPYRYQKALSCFAPNDTFGADGGLIGFDFLRHFNWTFDYPHGKVVLTPNGR